MRKTIFYAVARNLHEAMWTNCRLSREMAIVVYSHMSDHAKKFNKIWTIDARSWRPTATEQGKIATRLRVSLTNSKKRTK